MMNRPLVLTAVLLAGPVAGVAWLAAPGHDDGVAAPALPQARRSASPPSQAAPSTAPAPALTALSPALPLRLDSDGQLLIDSGTAPLLALQCHAAGRPAAAAPSASAQAQPQAQAQVEAQPQVQLQAHVKAQALQKQYCAYLEIVRQTPPAPPASLQEARHDLDALIALRRTFFDPATADRLFDMEEALAAHTLAVAAIEQDARLGATEKAARVAALRRALPPEVAALETPVPSRDDVERLRSQGGDESRQQLQRTADIARMWHSRYQAYAEQKQPILAAGLADADKAALIEDLLGRHFAPGELAAARAYDRQQSSAAGAAP